MTTRRSCDRWRSGRTRSSSPTWTGPASWSTPGSPSPPSPPTGESARALLRRYAEKQAADTGRLYGIWLEGTLVGGVLFRIFDTASGNCEIGVWLEPAAQGRGLITRAAERLIDWAVYDRGMHRVEWDASAANTRSIAVAKRLGMTRDGVIRQNYLYQGVRHDSEVWSVLAPEWKARTAR